MKCLLQAIQRQKVNIIDHEGLVRSRTREWDRVTANENEASFWGDKNVLELMGSDGCTTL